MIEVKINKATGTNMELTLSGGSRDICEEASIMLVAMSEAIARNTDSTFDEVFGSIVQGAKLFQFFKSKIERRDENGKD